MDYGFCAPINWFGLPESERATRSNLTDDICIIDGEQRYVWGCVEIPLMNPLIFDGAGRSRAVSCA